MELKTQVHNIPPLYDEKSRVLILGSFPSVKSCLLYTSDAADD